MKVVGYTRVSTLNQVEDGISLDSQRAKIKSWGEMNGVKEIQVFTDQGISGGRADNRPGLQAALDAVGKGDAFVVYSLSRLSRSTRDMLTLADVLQKKDADLVSLTERIDTTSAAGKMIFRLLSVLAEFERDLASDRTREALRFKKQNGEKCGGSLPPFGYQANKSGKLYADPKEQEAVRLILDRHESGESLRSIARELEAVGYRRKAGSARWHPQAVLRIIEREKSLIEHKTESRHLSLDA